MVNKTKEDKEMIAGILNRNKDKMINMMKGFMNTNVK